MNARTVESCSERGNTEVTELVRKVQGAQRKRKVFLHMWSDSAGIICRKDKNVERNNGTSDDSVKRCAMANQDKRFDKAGTSVKQAKIIKPQSIIVGKNMKKKFAGCADRWVQDADYRKCMQQKKTARTKPWKIETKSLKDSGKPTR